MEENNKIYERELIQRCRRGDKEARNEFTAQFRPIIKKKASGILLDKAEAEDSAQNILMKVLGLIDKGEKIENLHAWLIRITENFCYDENRKKRSRKALKFVQPEHNKVHEDHRAFAPGSREYYESQEEETISSDLDFEFKKNIPPSIRKSLEKSLDYVEFFYLLQKQISSDVNKFIGRTFDLYNILSYTKKKINSILGPISWQKIGRFKYFQSINRSELSDTEMKEYKKLKKQEFKISIHKELDELLEIVSAQMFHNPLLNEMADLGKTPYNSHRYFGIWLSNLSHILPKMKIEPPRLFFSIWTKAKGLKKGSYTDLKKIKIIFQYFKKKTKGTDKEFLFNSIDERVSTFDAIRKSSYKKSANVKYYRKVANSIYRESFTKKDLSY